MDVSVKKDRKGRCWFVSHRRCGCMEGIFLTPEELNELRQLLNEMEL